MTERRKGPLKLCGRCHRTRQLHYREPPLCGGCYRTWHGQGKPDHILPMGEVKPYECVIEGIAELLRVLATDRAAYGGPMGGLDAEYVAARIGRSVRTVSRYQAKIRDNHPAVERAKQLI